MKANVGGIDRIIRIVVGIIIIAVGMVYKSWWGLVGVLILATGIFRLCWLYIPLGISTRKAGPPQPPAPGHP